MRYLIGFLIFIGMIVLVFVLILHSFSSNSTKSTTTPLVNYAYTNTIAQMTIDGPINADQTHFQLQMTVGQTQSNLTLFQGYQGSVVTRDTYQNNSASFGEFLRALDVAGYAKGDTKKTADTDPRGFCPTGERYTFELNNGQDIERFWATSCGGQGTFGGNVTTVKNLFIAQMPNFTTIIQNTDIY